jgi:hypothetical protein
METAPLKNFATWARTALIREVTARIAAVLAPGSSERVEQGKAVAALEKAVTADGGGDKGRAAVADKVAYTWFNRIIALRFMDANGFTGIGVVSPLAGVEVGQPEILAEAKRGVIDNDVASQATRTAVSGLLDGTRASVDPQGEAYGLLLADYCRYWNKAMPFMFEREGDFTELLIPANLLADDSVLNRSVNVLTEDVCQDVEVIGWLYQFYISERKDEVFAGFKKNKKAGADEIPAATQLFTPHWIVRYLVENSLGRLWMLNRPNSGLDSQMDYYIASVDAEADFLKIAKPEELKVIDPACGSGHMLTYAFDLLYAIYEEEGYGPAEIPGLILTHNLYGTEIDPRAGALAAFALTMKARGKQRTFFSKQVEPNICVIEPISFGPDEIEFLITRDGDRYAESAFWNQFAQADTYGSLIQPEAGLTARLSRHLESLDDGGDMLWSDTIDWASKVIAQAAYLGPRYSVVVANPPYMGSKNFSNSLREFATDRYPKAAGDLCTMFVERGLLLGKRNSIVGVVTSESWLFTTSFSGMRDVIFRRSWPALVAAIDRSAFGVVLNTAATILVNQPPGEAKSIFFRVPASVIAAGEVDALPPEGQAVYRHHVESFRSLPGAPLVFDYPPSLLGLYGRTKNVGELFDVKQGLATGDNDRYLRFWWEVSRGQTGRGFASRKAAAESGLRWFPYNKGGSPVAWWGNQDQVIDWAHDGRDVIAEAAAKWGSASRRIVNTEFYFRECLTWSKTGTSGARFRLLPPGFIFDINGMSIFGGNEDSLLDLLGYLNSQVARDALDVLAPTLTYQSGDVARLPRPDGGSEVHLVRELIDSARHEWKESEVAHEFARPSVLNDCSGALSTATKFVIDHAGDRRVRRDQLEERVSDSWLVRIEQASPDGAVEARPLRPSPGQSLNESIVIRDLVSYAVGCMFGRYSLDEPGLILADQGVTLHDYLAKVPSPTFTPDADNVIPIVEGDWFEDDIVERFRQFLRTAFGERHFEENLRFVTESLGAKNLRDYFVKSFYKDHVQRYKKRPIYWLFSSPKGSFNALIYMHRYMPSTVSTVLNEYLREFQAKLKASLEHAERSNDAKEADRLRKILLELDEYEHDVLYPLASQQIAIDLDDGVKTNYPKFGAALKKIPGLEASE